MCDEQQLLILSDREERGRLIEQLVKDSPLVLGLGINFPGKNKRHVLIDSLLKKGDAMIIEAFDVLEKVVHEGPDGTHFFYAIQGDAVLAKRKAVQCEEEHPLGRLFDLDVYHGSAKGMSRKDLGLMSRACFLCEREATLCMREGTHSLEEVMAFIERVVAERG